MYISGNVARQCTPIIVVLAAGTLAAAGCGKAGKGPALPADFLLTTADSSYWVSSDASGLHLRGAPVLLTRVDGRFHELFTTDDDRSHYHAIFVGQRLFARDVVRGDSVLLMADTVVPRLAMKYASAHPDDGVLQPNEDTVEEPGTTATADIEVIDVHGPYISFEYRTDVDVTVGPRTVDSHHARRGVLDLRSRTAVTLASLFGAAAADSAIASSLSEWDKARAAAVSGGDAAAENTRRAMSAFAFDARSFSISSAERTPRVRFAVPGETGNASARPVLLAPYSLPTPAWWSDVREQLPTGQDSVRQWKRGALTVIARALDGGDRARLIIRDGAGKEWVVGELTAPVQQLQWLDSSVSDATRQALNKLFDDANQGGDDRRIALAPNLQPDSHARLAARLTHRQGDTARQFVVDDAERREHARPRVWRGRSRTDRQDRRGVCHSARTA